MAARCYQVVLRLSGANLTRQREVATQLQTCLDETVDQRAKFGSERFGAFFRVAFYGEQFPAAWRNREFVFREAMASKLAEVAENVKVC